jgi:WD40 repeat protein
LFAVSFSPDGRTIATGDDKGRVTFWAAAARNQALVDAQSVSGNSDRVTGLSFNRSGSLLLSSSLSGGIQLYDTSSISRPRLIGTLSHRRPTNAAVLAPSGRTAFSGHDHAAFRWVTDPMAWRQVACDVAGRNPTKPERVRFLGSDAPSQMCPRWAKIDLPFNPPGY